MLLQCTLKDRIEQVGLTPQFYKGGMAQWRICPAPESSLNLLVPPDQAFNLCLRIRIRSFLINGGEKQLKGSSAFLELATNFRVNRQLNKISALQKLP